MWKKIEDEHDILHLNESDSVEGVLKQVDECFGDYNSNLYSIEVSEGFVVKLFGSAVLDRKLRKVPIESRIKIVYLGMKKGRKGDYKNFEVYVWQEVNEEII